MFVCMVFLRCMEPVVIEQWDQKLYVTTEPRWEWTSITIYTHLWPLNGMGEIQTPTTEMASEVSIWNLFLFIRGSWTLGGSFMVQKMATSSPIPISGGLREEWKTQNNYQTIVKDQYSPTETGIFLTTEHVWAWTHDLWRTSQSLSTYPPRS